MINITITSELATFYSTVSQSELTSNLYEPKWDYKDDVSFILNTEQCCFTFTIADYTLNDNAYSTVKDAIDYLNNL
jgi:hypothetical protein